MKKIMALLLILCFAIGFSACGGTEEANDPNLGVYEGATAEMWGIQLGIEEFWEGGFSVELKSNGKCTFMIDGKSCNAKWSLDGDEISVTGGGLDETGTLLDGVLKLEDVQGSGVTLVLINEDYEAPAAEEEPATEEEPMTVEEPETAEEPAAEETSEDETGVSAPQSGDGDNLYVISGIEANGMVVSGKEILESTGMTDTWLLFREDGTGTLRVSGEEEMEITWDDDGSLNFLGEPLFRYENIDESSIKLILADTVAYIMELAD